MREREEREGDVCRFCRDPNWPESMAEKRGLCSRGAQNRYANKNSVTALYLSQNSGLNLYLRNRGARRNSKRLSVQTEKETGAGTQLLVYNF